jgi:hypothetical protein
VGGHKGDPNRPCRPCDDLASFMNGREGTGGEGLARMEKVAERASMDGEVHGRLD